VKEREEGRRREGIGRKEREGKGGKDGEGWRRGSGMWSMHAYASGRAMAKDGPADKYQ